MYSGSLDINYVGPFELTYPPYGMFMTLAGPNSDKHLVSIPALIIASNKGILRLAYLPWRTPKLRYPPVCSRFGAT